jgi:hypothetical protein
MVKAPLTKSLGVAGGQSFAQSIASAEAAVAQLADEANTHLDASVDTLLRLATRCDDPAALQEVTTEIFTVAGAFERLDVSDAAKLLNDLVTETRDGPRWSPKAIQMFANAVASLHRGGEGSPRELVATLQVFASRVLAGTAKL